MPELSNLLRQRLAVTGNGAAQLHPDADTLTAFVEQSLPSTENETVVAHLAVCEPCREVVVLTQSLTAELATQTVLTPAPVARWRRLFTPVFGAAAFVAAMAVIAFMVFQLPQKHPQQSLNSPANRPTSSPTAQETQQAKATSIGDQPASTEAKAAAPAETHSESVGGLDLAVRAKEESETHREGFSRAKAAIAVAPATNRIAPPAASSAKAPVLTAALQKKDYVNTNFFTSSNADNVVLDGQGNSLPPAPQPQPSAARNTFATANSKMTIFADLPANEAGKSNARILTSTPPQEHSGWAFGKIVQSTARSLHLHSPVGSPALRAYNLSSSALGGPGMFSGAIEKSQSAEISAAPARADADSFAAS
ncbi:MAG TPA: hypothetical protein VN872_13265, partial [Candidatus Acidoferrum sp.]|nr:hypothetical protein [Candidatus Acidoferrum sp.]